MSSTSRNRILSRLHAAPRDSFSPSSNDAPVTADTFDRREKISRLKKQMEAMRTEVHVVDESSWVEAFAKIARKKGLSDVLYSPETDVGTALERHWESDARGEENLPELIPYDEDVEEFKQQLFKAAASITTSNGAVGDSGAIILWPDEREPRTMSLVPPVHFVVLKADAVYSNLSEVIEKENWQAKMPANAVLISGPSKTADIELTLAFGVHGPKELVVLIQI